MSSSRAGGSSSSSSLLSSASTIVADAAHGSHTLRIQGYTRTKRLRTGEHLDSCDFKVGAYSWCIHFYPNGCDAASADHVSLFLALRQSVPSALRVEYRIQLVVDGEVEAAQQPPPSHQYVKERSFSSHANHGYHRFINRKELERSRYLIDESFAIRCEIAVVNFRADGAASRTTSRASVPPSNLHQHLGNLLSSQQGADVSFEVGDETLKAHRWLLAARSPVFSAELFGAMMESDSGAVVRVDDMEADVFRALLHFVYTDGLPGMSSGEEEFVMSQHLLVASDRYDLERLKFLCEDNLCRHIEVSNVAAVLELADTHHCPRLKDACFDFLKDGENLEAVLATDIFEHLLTKCPSITLELIAKLGASSRMQSRNNGFMNAWDVNID